MAVVTKQELEDASVDAQTLEDVTNGAADLNGNGTVTSRLGQVIKTVAKSIQDLNTVGVVTSAISALEVEIGAPASSLVIKADGDLEVTGGINLGGSAAEANKLDDYEEGTWTPAFENIGTGTYATQEGTYTKIGRLVTIKAFISVATVGTASGNLIITLPFVSNGALTAQLSSVVGGAGWSTGRDNVGGQINGASSSLGIYYNLCSASSPTVTHADLGTGSLLVTMTYEVA